MKEVEPVEPVGPLAGLPVEPVGPVHIVEVVSKPQIRFEGKAQADEKAQQP